MKDITVFNPQMFPPASAEGIDKIHQVEGVLRQLEQIEVHTQHMLHGSMYARTVALDPGVMITGALMKVPSILILDGDVEVYAGSLHRRYTGHAVMAGSAGRKGIFYAHQQSFLTMIFATDADTIEEAEKEFTDEHEDLMSRHGINEVVITGEKR